MELFFLDEKVQADGTAVLTGQQARHIGRVLRHRPGDVVFATDGRGSEYELELTGIRRDRVLARVRNVRQNPREPACRLALAQGILKGDRLTQVVESAAELGVAEIIPLRTARTVAGLSAARLARLRSVAVEAVKCSTRTVVPEVLPATGLGELAERMPDFDRTVVAYEEEKEGGLGDVLEPAARSVLLVVGPEGGFEPEEVRGLAARGARCFSLGPRRFRAKTAAVAATAMVLHLVGDLGGRATERCQKGGVSEAWQVLS